MDPGVNILRDSIFYVIYNMDLHKKWTGGTYSMGVHFLHDIILYRKWTPIEYGPGVHILLVVYVSTVESGTDQLNSKVQRTNWFCLKH